MVVVSVVVVAVLFDSTLWTLFPLLDATRLVVVLVVVVLVVVAVTKTRDYPRVVVRKLGRSNVLCLMPSSYFTTSGSRHKTLFVDVQRLS